MLTDASYTGGSGRTREYESVQLLGTTHEERESAAAAAMHSFAPDVVLTQLIWADVALRTAKLLGVKSILRIPSLPMELEVGEGSPFQPTVLIAPSEFARIEVASRSKRFPFLIRMPIDVERSRVNRRQPKYYTMFNPIELKGGELFRSLATLLPDRAFAIVPGWKSLRHPDGSWNESWFRISSESMGRTYDGYLPREVDFSGLSNVVRHEPREAVGEIFEVARALIVPSVWPEVGGRVTLEAMANGIPVVASAVGGLVEVVGGRGVLVERYMDPEAWRDAVLELDDPAFEEGCRRRGEEYVAREYSLDGTIDRFSELLDAIAALPPGRTLDAW